MISAFVRVDIFYRQLGEVNWTIASAQCSCWLGKLFVLVIFRLEVLLSMLFVNILCVRVLGVAERFVEPHEFCKEISA